MVPFRSCTAGNCISCRQKNCGKCRVCSIKYARKRNPRVYRIDFFESLVVTMIFVFHLLTLTRTHHERSSRRNIASHPASAMAN